VGHSLTNSQNNSPGKGFPNTLAAPLQLLAAARARRQTTHTHHVISRTTSHVTHGTAGVLPQHVREAVRLRGAHGCARSPFPQRQFVTIRQALLQASSLWGWDRTRWRLLTRLKTSTGILLEVYGSVIVYLQDIESAYI
jgi:hypothetical protein